MAVIENKIQYDWVRKRVAKLKEKVDENTSSYNPYRIELELLSKLEKEYSDEHADILEKEQAFITETTPKTQVHIYEGLPIILEKVKSVALSAVTGKTNAWMKLKLARNIVNGKPAEFKQIDIELINKCLPILGDEILSSLVDFSENREEVIIQIKELGNYIRMPYIYKGVMKKSKVWYDGRMLIRKGAGRDTSFKEDDILAINMTAMQIAYELKSTEFIL